MEDVAWRRVAGAADNAKTLENRMFDGGGPPLRGRRGRPPRRSVIMIHG
jgi:hypothetical protein